MYRVCQIVYQKIFIYVTFLSLSAHEILINLYYLIWLLFKTAFSGFFRCLELLKWRKRLDSRSLRHRMLMWACLYYSCLRQKRMFPCLWFLTVHCLCLSDRGSGDAFPVSLCTVQRRRSDNIKGTERSVNQKGTCSLMFLTLCWNNFQTSFTKIQLNEDKKKFGNVFVGEHFANVMMT